MTKEYKGAEILLFKKREDGLPQITDFFHHILARVASHPLIQDLPKIEFRMRQPHTRKDMARPGINTVRHLLFDPGRVLGGDRLHRRRQFRKRRCQQELVGIRRDGGLDTALAGELVQTGVGDPQRATDLLQIVVELRHTMLEPLPLSLIASHQLPHLLEILANLRQIAR